MKLQLTSNYDMEVDNFKSTCVPKITQKVVVDADLSSLNASLLCYMM